MTSRYAVLLLSASDQLGAHLARLPPHLVLHHAPTLAAAVAQLHIHAITVLLLDLDMPNAQQWGKQLRQQTALPILGIVAAAQTRATAVVEGWVDATIDRLAPLHEWVLQIRALAHRHQHKRRGVATCGDLTIDLVQQEVRRADAMVPLSPTAWRLLSALVQHAPAPLSPLQLVEWGWGRPDGASPEDIRKWISRLRKQLSDNPARPRYILNARRGSYRCAAVVWHAAAAPPQAQPSPAVRPASLPAPLTSFIGRRAERADLQRLVIEKGARLITLVGPAGVGKTRLALQVATDMRAAFQDAVVFVPLADLTSAGQLLPRLAHALGLQDHPHPVPDHLVTHLRQTCTLLLVDTVEHLADTTARLLVQLLQDVPTLVVLATSRVPLDVYGEAIYGVEPLPVPPLTDHAPEVLEDTTAIAQSDAVQLFVDRAGLVQPHRVWTAADRQLVAQICAHVDGLPLAIELAAARTAQLPLAAIVAGLRHQQHLDLLVSPHRDRDARQRTLRGAIAWSDALLDAAEQRLFRRLSLFAGPFTADAAHAVGGASDDPQQTTDTLHALTRHNMLVPLPTAADPPAWTMLESVRAYAADQLEQDAALPALLQRRATYYTDLLAAADEGLLHADRARWLTRLEQEHATIRAVLGWAQQHQAQTYLLRITAALWRFWMARGYLHEGRHWCAVALNVDAPSPDGTAADVGIWARAYHAAGALALTDEDHAAAQTGFTQALARYRQLQDPLGIARTLMNLGLVEHRRGAAQAAYALLTESLAYYRQLGAPDRMPGILYNLSDVAISLGDLDRAEQLLHEVVQLSQRYHYAEYEASADENLGDIAHLRDDPATAVRWYTAALAHYQTSGSLLEQARVQVRIARVQTDSQVALTELRTVLAQRTATSDPRTTVEALEALSMVLTQRNHLLPATILWSAAQAARHARSMPATILEQRLYAAVTAARTASLSATTALDAHRQGAALSLDAALELARQAAADAGDPDTSTIGV